MDAVQPTPDHREHPPDDLLVTASSEYQEVMTTVEGDRLSSLDLDEAWLASVRAHDAATLMASTVNQALDDWQTQQREKLRTMLPNLTELSGSLSALRHDNPNGWVSSLADHRHSSGA